MIAQLGVRLRRFDPASILVSPRAGFDYRHPEFGLMEWMPICIKGEYTLIKIVGYHPANPVERDLPTILSTLASFDTTTGHLLTLVDGTLTTAIRTGAASALASQVLARPDSEVVGIIGCGAQAVTQAHALSRIFNLRRIIACDTDPSAAETFHERIEFLDLEVQTMPITDVEKLVAASDILCTCTSCKAGNGPVFSAARYRKHLHINAVGSDFPGKTEVPYELLVKSTVFPDFLEQALREGECQQLESGQIGPDLVSMVKHANSYAGFQNELTVFDSTGWAFEDQVALELLSNYARELGVGSEMEIECISRDAKNPYDLSNSSFHSNINRILDKESIPKVVQHSSRT